MERRSEKGAFSSCSELSYFCAITKIPNMKKLLLFSLAVFLWQAQGQAQTDELISNLKHLTPQQLYDTANYYLFTRNSFDTALLCYGFIINMPQSVNREQQIRVISSLNRTGAIYLNMCDYRNAYKYLIDALRLCEKYNIVDEQYKIYNNLGNIYFYFNKIDIAKPYYSKTLSLCKDTAIFCQIFNNLGYAELQNQNIDSAFYFIEKSLQFSKKYNSKSLSTILNTAALIYQETQQYDSAIYYYNLALKDARKNNDVVQEVQNLFRLSKLFFELNQTDSALFYIELSNILILLKM
jgi:tetratricopeptide (TPR) repeat protein